MSEDERAEWLNMEAYLALEGLRTRVADRLIELLRSDVPLDPILRSRLADALVKGPDDSGIRLEVRGTGQGHRDLPAELIQTRRRWLIAGKQIEALHAGGMTIDEAKRQLRRLVDFNGEVFGLSGGSAAANAWNFYQDFRAFQAAQTNMKPISFELDFIMLSIIKERPDLLAG